MRKTLFSLVTIFALLNNVYNLEVCAESEIIECNDSILVVNTRQYNGFLVETDGTVLDEEILSEVSGFVSIENWSDFNQSACGHWTEHNVTPGEYAYMVSINGNTNDMYEVGRQLMLKYDYITNISIVTETDYAYGTWLDYCFAVEFSTGVTPESLDISELGEFTWYHSFGNLYGCFLENAEDSEFVKRINADTQYEEYVWGVNFSEELLSKYTEITDMFPDIVVPVANDVKGESYSIWQTAGDHNADGEVNSNDAADLLVQAAQEGVAEASETAVSPDSDVNLDGVADSTDAAYILQYAALKGSGADADWVEILK